MPFAPISLPLFICPYIFALYICPYIFAPIYRGKIFIYLPLRIYRGKIFTYYGIGTNSKGFKVYDASYSASAKRLLPALRLWREGEGGGAGGGARWHRATSAYTFETCKSLYSISTPRRPHFPPRHPPTHTPTPGRARPRPPLPPSPPPLPIYIQT